MAFFSKSLHKAETHYSAFNRELLALYLAIKHFHYFLEGCSFTTYTDHKPLTFAIWGSGDSWSPCMSRYLSYIAEFTTDIWHIIDKQNIVQTPSLEHQSTRLALLSPHPWTLSTWLFFKTRILTSTALQKQDFVSKTSLYRVPTAPYCVMYPCTLHD